MARIKRILESNEKKLIITDFLADEVKEKNEDGSYKEEFITIVKLSREVKTKIKFMSINTLSGQTGKNIFKKMQDKGLNSESLEAMPNEEKAKLMLDFDFNIDDGQAMETLTVEMEKCIIEHGIHLSKHSFCDENGKAIELNYDFWNAFSNDKLLEFLISQIKLFSKGFSLGE